MDGEPEALSDTATNCNLACASETLSDVNQAKLDSLEKKAVHLRFVHITKVIWNCCLFIFAILLG